MKNRFKCICFLDFCKKKWGIETTKLGETINFLFLHFEKKFRSASTANPIKTPFPFSTLKKRPDLTHFIAVSINFKTINFYFIGETVV